MGLFSFLSRGNGSKTKKTKIVLKPGVSYTSFCPSPVPPDLSSADNAPGCTDTPPKGRREHTQSQLSLGAPSEDEAPAPAPGVLRYREDHVERPSTAPGGSPPSTVFLRPGSRLKGHGERRPPPLSFRTARPQTAAPGPRPGSSGSISTGTSLFRRAPDHSRANSLRSDAGKAFMDILDAQSEIKPADFRARVQASGAREYGEDVAERNMGENGFDLQSPHVLAFYGQDRAYQSNDEPGPLPRFRPGSRLGPHEIGMRRRSLRLSDDHTLSRPLSPYGPTRSSSRASHSGGSGRRRSVCTYMPLSIGSNGRLSPIGPGPVGLDSLSPRTPAPEPEDLEFGFAALGTRSPIIPSLPATAPAPVVRTARFPRDSVVLAKQRVDTPVSEDDIDDSVTMISALHSATRPRRSSTITSAASLSRKHHSVHTLRPSVSLSSASRDTVVQVAPLSHPPKTPGENQLQEVSEGPADDIDPALFENHEPDSTDPNVRHEDSAVQPPQPRSFPLVNAQKEDNDLSLAVLDDDPLDYPPPIRTRSVRGWSASSGTPTTAESTVTASTATASITTASSRAFHRPPSLHTADTSVDMDFDLLDRKPSTPTAAASTHGASSILHDEESDSSSSSTESDKHHNQRSTAANFNNAKLDINELLPPPTAKSASFNMDDYLSSDAESLSSLALATTISSRRPTAEGEEELLFREGGYGAAGLCPLPGLADVDLFPAAVPALGGIGDERRGKRSSYKGKGLRKGRSSPVLAGVSSSSRRAMVPGVDDCDVDVDVRRWGGLSGSAGMDMDYGLFGNVGRVKGNRMARISGGRRELVLGTAARDDDTDGESGSECEPLSHGATWRREKRRQALRRRGRGNVDDDGYDADFVEDEEEGRISRRCERSKKRAGRPSTLSLTANSQTEVVGRQQEQQDKPQQHELAEGKPELKVDITSAVRLRKQVKRARRLAGETSYASLRQARTRMSLPVLRVDAAV